MGGSEIKAESDRLLKRLDELTIQADTSTIADIQDYERKHRAFIRQKYGRFMSQFEMYFSSITMHAHHQNYIKREHWPTHRAVQYSAAVHALKPIYSAYTLFCSGFYEDSIILLRSAYETFVRILYISCHPDNPYHALVRDKKLPRLNITAFIKQDLKLQWTKYSIMSMFYHGNWIAVVDSILDNQNKTDPKAITLTYELNEDMIGLVTNNFLFIMAAYMNLITRLFTVDYSGHPQAEKELAKANEYADILIRNLKTHTKNQYWREVGQDLSDIFGLIEKLEASPKSDWKKEWHKIRKQLVTAE